MRSLLASRFSLRALLLVIGVLAGAGSAGATTIQSRDCYVQANNLMRFDCHVELSNSDTVRIGFRPQAGGSWTWSGWRTGQVVDIVLYNFQPDVAYEYKVQVAAGPVSPAVNLPATPTLPADLGDLNLVFTKRGGEWQSAYVIFDTKDCKGAASYLVAVQVDGEYIAWYQDIAAETSIPGAEIHGWSYSAENTMLVIVDQQEIHEWAWDGSATWSITGMAADCAGAPGDQGPCPHHDAFRNPDNGRTYVLTGTEDATLAPADCPPFQGTPCETAFDTFVDDGFQEFPPPHWSEHTLMGDMGYDPSLDDGPDDPDCGSSYWGGTFEAATPALDWTHVNSVFASQEGLFDLVTLSSRQWDEVIRYNASTRSVMWKLNGSQEPGYGDFSIVNDSGILSGEADFGGQHHVTESNGRLLMFDNRTHRTVGGARVIELDPDTGTSVATITKSWEMRLPTLLTQLDCTSGLGSAVYVPGTYGNSVLAVCGHQTDIQEIDEHDGMRTLDPTLDIKLDADPTGGWDTCRSGPLATSPGIHWYRAWPLDRLGEF